MNPLLEILDVSKSYPVSGGTLQALREVSLSVYKGETIGLVGESGCGKSTLARLLVALEKPSSGTIRFKGDDFLKINTERLKKARAQIQMIFQDPFSSLNPRMNAFDIIAEPLEIHNFPRKAILPRVHELLEIVGLHASMAERYPHEFSGGQRQRIGIARALALQPDCLICDEPISSLDVSVRAQIINLLKDLQDKFQLTYVFIAHDLSVVKYLSDRVAVMYLGKIVELASSDTLYTHPSHPYTQALLAAIPIPDPIQEKQRQKTPLKGEIPSPLSQIKGCPFASRCPKVQEMCHNTTPSLRETSSGHFVSCHFAV